LGVDDVSYLDIETMRTLAYLRFSVQYRITSRYPRHKLADDGTPIAPGQAIATPKTIRLELIALFMDWMDAGLAENLGQFKEDLIVQRNTSDKNRVDAIIPPDVINQFRVFAASLQFRL
jgi:phage tail sheath gpL-like